ncbi:inositol monophosphatase family protein [Amycolatopsis pithecellobii]|uniref:3'(2'),5'-bisphosphate nucleotidase CysQ n=1 Tax=Amycolatopsis pithecellobii TaxID=664692 RepID=A0A6N7Z4B0_9PSEU|nr:inositol monophosphatase family protein [Amycolatopsis pithecellobii]MTD55241.1 3'(2'),5'-bisphosphate nucleotidase CysQ [Amycolatopsis pithecellobii]
MPTSPSPAFTGENASVAEDKALLPAVVAAVETAGAHLRERFSPDARVDNLDETLAAIDANDAASLGFLREPLENARPGARWADDEQAGGTLPAGEWWITDPVEGNINHIHGMTDWSVTAALVRDNQPVLTAVHLPLTGDTYTAVRGDGAYLNGVPLRVSVKPSLDAALVATGQSKPGETAETYDLIGRSVTAMLNAALVTRVAVPTTLQLVQVAAGRMDAFWQYSGVRSGLVAGALLVVEAGGTVTDTHGRPWNLASGNFLATAPALHPAIVEILSAVG